MYFIRCILLFFCLTNSAKTSAQIFGQIVDENNEPLPYASVVVAETSLGVSSNAEGKYVLALSKGTYRLNFQYV